MELHCSLVVCIVIYTRQEQPKGNTMNTKNMTVAQIETAMRTRLIWIAEGNDIEDDRNALAELAIAYANLTK